MPVCWETLVIELMSEWGYHLCRRLPLAGNVDSQTPCIQGLKPGRDAGFRFQVPIDESDRAQ